MIYKKIFKAKKDELLDMKYNKCPVCSSKNFKIGKDDVLGEFIICKNCGFDESSEYDEDYGDERSRQKGKSSFSPYKTGGGRRSAKK